jgi:hypothetical protein
MHVIVVWIWISTWGVVDDADPARILHQIRAVRVRVVRFVDGKEVG